MAHWERYTVKGAQEETGCDWCGGPIYNGESAYMLQPSEDAVCCSKGCGSNYYKAAKPVCGCTDPGCPAHPEASSCRNTATAGTLFRIDMEDETGTDFCSACSEDAFDSGLFETRP